MKNIEVKFEDQTQLPILKAEEIHSANDKLYLIRQFQQNPQVQILGNIYDGAHQKELINITGNYLGDFSIIGSDVFFLDDNDGLYKLNEENILQKIKANELTNQKYFEFMEMQTDGEKLYIQSSKSPEFLIVDTNLTLNERIKMESNEFYSGNGIVCINKDEDFHIHKNGKLERVLNINNLEKNSEADRMNAIMESVYNKNNKTGSDAKLNELNYSNGAFLGNKGMYIFMTSGEIYYPTEDGGINLGGDWGKSEKAKIIGTSNENNSFIFTPKKVGIFDGEIQTGENELRTDISKVKSITADNDFIYMLEGKNTVKRYKIKE
jgi:hypothetical protein